MRKAKVAITIGTRPELIKLAPVVRELQRRHHLIDKHVIFTAQHRQMLDQAAEFFEINADADLDLMRADQGLGELTARMLPSLSEELRCAQPDMVLAQGDTTTVFVTALTCFYLKIPFGHVEAGLRSGSKANPFPEEANRRLVSVLADIHFAPTAHDRKALLGERIAAGTILVTGNTGVDAVMEAAAREVALPISIDPGDQLAVLTMHRRESFGAPLESVFSAVKALARARRQLRVVCPIHPNPAVRETAERVLGSCRNVDLINPLPYGAFVALLKRATVVLTDSGGIQEEAPSLGVPVLVLRETTERPQAVEAGTARLIGTERDAILEHATELLDAPSARAAMVSGANPFGDGKASTRIVDAVLEFVSHRQSRGDEMAATSSTVREDRDRTVAAAGRG